MFFLYFVSGSKDISGCLFTILLTFAEPNFDIFLLLNVNFVFVVELNLTVKIKYIKISSVWNRLNKYEGLFFHITTIFVILDGRFDNKVLIVWSTLI